MLASLTLIVSDLGTERLPFVLKRNRAPFNQIHNEFTEDSFNLSDHLNKVVNSPPMTNIPVESVENVMEFDLTEMSESVPYA